MWYVGQQIGYNSRETEQEHKTNAPCYLIHTFICDVVLLMSIVNILNTNA